MLHIIFKKRRTLETPLQVSFSFHGSNVNIDFINHINEKFRVVKVVPHHSRIEFRIDKSSGNYAVLLDPSFHHKQDDVIVTVFDMMVELGYICDLQYDEEHIDSEDGGKSLFQVFLFRYGRPIRIEHIIR